MDKRTIRPTREEDSATVMAMYDHSRSLMRATGNTTQWVGYPTLQQLRADMELGVSYIIEDMASTPIGTFALVPGVEPTYTHIDHGRWIDSQTPYATVHRIAKTPGSLDIASTVFDFARQRHTHLRVDTHESNLPMLHIIEREGFVHCGTVYMNDGTPRLAYEWWRWQLPEGLQQWVESMVFTKYKHFDAAHRADHARRVVARAMALMPTPTTYVAAAMHDLGLAEGREEHHLASGRIIRSCSDLRRWFSDEEVELIAQAAEDHRASAAQPPRSHLGMVIAEADRDVEPERIVRRTVEYGLSHYPTLDREGHWQRTLQHLHEKYAEGGYIQLWLADSPNAAPLAELRNLIADTPRLRQLFDHLFNSLSPTPNRKP